MFTILWCCFGDMQFLLFKYYTILIYYGNGIIGINDCGIVTSQEIILCKQTIIFNKIEVFDRNYACSQYK